MNKKIIVLGRGFLGREFERQGFDVWGKDKFIWPFKPRPFSTELPYSTPDTQVVIINTIGKTSTRECEKNPQEAIEVNGNLVKYFKYSYPWVKLVHISTGCLYDNYLKINTEEDFISAHCAYTMSKWVGESYCDKEKDLIIRPRLLFGSESVPQNFLHRLKSYKNAITHRHDSLTNITDLVLATKALIDNDATGVYNVCNQDYASIREICNICDIHRDKDDIYIEALREQQGIYLVNNVMSTKKLEQYYQPRNLQKTIKEEWEKMNGKY